MDNTGGIFTDLSLFFFYPHLSGCLRLPSGVPLDMSYIIGCFIVLQLTRLVCTIRVCYFASSFVSYCLIDFFILFCPFSDFFCLVVQFFFFFFIIFSLEELIMIAVISQRSSVG